MDSGNRETYLTELFVHLQDLIGDLGASHHGSLAHLLQHGARQENELFVLFILVVLDFLVMVMVGLF